MEFRNFIELYDGWKNKIKVIDNKTGTTICTKIELLMLQDEEYHIPSIMHKEIKAFRFEDNMLNVWI